MVWFICNNYPAVSASFCAREDTRLMGVPLYQVAAQPAYCSMVFAWSFTEVVRYTHYATGLMDYTLSSLEWLRYASSPPSPKALLTLVPAGTRRSILSTLSVLAPKPPSSGPLSRTLASALPIPRSTNSPSSTIHQAYGPIAMWALGAILAIWPPGTSLFSRNPP